MSEQAPAAPVPAAFDEAAYLDANPDVAAAVRQGQFQSGRQHYDLFGRSEKRRLGSGTDSTSPRIDLAAKARKLRRIEPILRPDMTYTRGDGCFDFLTDELRQQFRIVDTDAVSSNDYDGHAVALIERHRDGLVLDCGAGKRGVYYENVVNFEIAPYDSTDVRGVGEVLPFVDGSFDAVISIAVLEHVKDPFACASEISRVLKPGGDLMCCVPFLQPYHGYPHHYYNMTHHGLANLFEPTIEIDRIDVYGSVLPIWSLSWMVSSWADGLSGETRESFLDMPLRSFLGSPLEHLESRFVTELSEEKNRELASACVLFGQKRPG